MGGACKGGLACYNKVNNQLDRNIEVSMTKTLKQETVLVGMTGRIDSTVAAYLLKKQGMNVIGIGILFNEIDETPPRDPKTGELIKPFGVHFINDLQRVKGVCDELEIPFYGVHAVDRYKAAVLDNIVAARLGGSTFSPYIFSTRLILEILGEKMSALGATQIATGNYAKVSINPSTGAIGVSQSNDLENDESFQLAKISPRNAASLNLPLSEMRRKEVVKIYDSLHLTNLVESTELKGDKATEFLLMEDPRLEEVVVANSSEDLRREGSLINHFEDTTICEHEGIHRFFIGQTKVKTKNSAAIDQKLQVVKIDPTRGNVYIGSAEKLKFSFCEVKSFATGKDRDYSIPLDAYVKFRPDLQKVPCDIYLGNNESARIEFKNEQKGQLVKGQYIVIYDRDGEGAKVIGAGIVNRSGFYDELGKQREYPLTRDEITENADDDKQVSKTIFKF
ncbi:MAG: tRNA-specific 2-thiouridylase [Bacteriovoracaceae bacterium]|jgi:tRNA-specific 2-thiouridylase